MKIVKTQPRFSTNALSLRERARVSTGSVTGAAAVDLSVRQIFFALGNGELFSLYEAAEVDGAGKWTRFWHVTLPGIRPVLVFMVLVGTIGSLQLFELPYVLFQGAGPNFAKRSYGWKSTA